MAAAAATNVTFVVLDRPNPITGLDAFGPVLNESFITSYVGRRAIAQAHGMTVGELSKLFVGEGWIQEASNGSSLNLEVVIMKNWSAQCHSIKPVCRGYFLAPTCQPSTQQ
jgi:uncharacterized protein YbbC (DUF1343 family)